MPPDVVLVPGPASCRAPRHGPGAGGWTARTTIGPFDERVFNPIGFEAVVDGPVVDLASLRGQPPPRRWSGRCGRRPASSGRGDAGARGRAVDGRRAGRGPDGGSTSPTRWPARSTRWCSGARRCATFSTAAWRRRAAELAGVRVASEPSVSVVLATRRPEMLGFALRQVRRQAGVDVQLVLAAHGFEPDPDVIARARPGARRRPPAVRRRAVRRRAQRRCRGGRRRPGAEDGRRRLVRPRLRRRPPARPRLLRRRDGRHAGRVPLPRREGRHRPARPPDRALRAVRRRRHHARRARPAPRGGRLPVRAQLRRRPAHRRGPAGRRRDVPHPRPGLPAAPQRHRPHLAGRRRLPPRPRPRRRDPPRLRPQPPARGRRGRPPRTASRR